MTTEKRNDEIDLIEVFFRLFRFFKKNILILIVSVIIGAGIGYSVKFFKKDYYKSEMIIESYTLSEEVRFNYIKEFNNLLEDKNYELLKDKTGLEITDLQNIININAESDEDKSNDNIIFIKVKVLDTSVLTKLALGIQSYMNSFSYVRNEIEIFKENNISLLKDIDEFVIESENPSQIIYYINDINNKKFVHNEVLDILEAKQEIKKELIYAVPFRVIKDFTVYNNPINNNKKNTIKGAFIAFLISIISLVIIEINKKVN